MKTIYTTSEALALARNLDNAFDPNAQRPDVETLFQTAPKLIIDLDNEDVEVAIISDSHVFKDWEQPSADRLHFYTADAEHYLEVMWAGTGDERHAFVQAWALELENQVADFSE